MYLARFSYHLLPVNREAALAFIRHEVEEARTQGLHARLLVPVTRGRHGAALVFELELGSLEQLDRFRHREDHGWMHDFSLTLLSPPEVEILHVDDVDPRAAESVVANDVSDAGPSGSPRTADERAAKPQGRSGSA